MATNNDYSKLVQFFTGSALPETKNPNALYFITTEDKDGQHIGKLYKGNVLIAQTNDENYINSIESALNQFKTDVAKTYATKEEFNAHIELYRALLQIAEGNRDAIAAILKDAPEDLKTFAAVDAKFDGILNGAKLDSFGDVETAISNVQGEVDALEGYVGEFETPTGEDGQPLSSVDTVVKYIDYRTKDIASGTALGQLTQRVTQAETDIDAIENVLNDVGETKGLKSRMTQAEADILANAAAAKQAQDEVDALETLHANDKKALSEADEALDRRVNLLENGITGLTGAMHFRGVFEELPKPGEDGKYKYTDDKGVEAEFMPGDVIIVGQKEYVFNPTSEAPIGPFVELGDVSAQDQAISALQGRVKTVEDDLNTAETGLKARMTKAEQDIATKASQADLNALDERVDDLEADLNTATTGLKARVTAVEEKAETNRLNIAENVKDIADNAKAIQDEAARATEVENTLIATLSWQTIQ